MSIRDSRMVEIDNPELAKEISANERYLRGVYETLTNGDSEDIRNLAEEIRNMYNLHDAGEIRDLKWRIDDDDPAEPLLIECEHQWLTKYQINELIKVCERALKVPQEEEKNDSA